MLNAIIRVQVICIAVLAASAGAVAQGWQIHSDPEYGTTALYPGHIFSPVPSPDIPGQSFLSADGRARMAIGAWDNEGNESPAVYRDRLLADPNHPNITYHPKGRSWFVVSGYRGDNIYYEKVMYSCGWRVVNAFGIVYPVSDRAIYDPIVERMEDSFRPGRRCN